LEEDGSRKAASSLVFLFFPRPNPEFVFLVAVFFFAVPGDFFRGLFFVLMFASLRNRTYIRDFPFFAQIILIYYRSRGGTFSLSSFSPSFLFVDNDDDDDDSNDSLFSNFPDSRDTAAHRIIPKTAKMQTTKKSPKQKGSSTRSDPRR
jgi:hypothetical protein